MTLDLIQKWMGLLSGGTALIAGSVTALWVFTKYIIERGLLPPVQFDVDCRFTGTQCGKKLLEIMVHLKNLSSSTLIASDIRVDVRYMADTDNLSVFEDPMKSTFGRLRFPHSLRTELHKDEVTDDKRGLWVVPYDTFVQSGVDQVYTLITAIPESASYVLIWSSFQYAQHPTPISRFVLFISRRLGLIQYSLSHATKPHTVEHVFQLTDPK
jgi:hypothetical protein